MASWKFTDEYGTKYPALNASLLSLLVFSDHAITGTSFTGVLDVAASGAVLATIGALVNLPSIDVSGTVTDAGTTLTVQLTSTDQAAFTQGIAKNIPLIGNNITQNAWMTVNTVTNTTDDPDVGPQVDEIALAIVIAVGTHSVQLTAQVPMNGGFFTVTGVFQGVGVGLSDLNFLMGSLASGNAWFPATQLGPYYQKQPALELLTLSLTMYIGLQPLTVSISSVTVAIGITKLPILGQKLYLNPLAVWITVTDPTGSPKPAWGIEGEIMLCNYARPGDLNNPDFTFEFDLDLTNFTFSGQFENPSQLPVNTMLQDLLGQSTSVGLPSALTIDLFDFSATADKTTGSLTEFSTDIAFHGGFGVFENFDLEQFSLSVAYSS
jgi:hypothetical protein